MELSGLTNIYGDYLTQQVDEAKTAKMKNTVQKITARLRMMSCWMCANSLRRIFWSRYLNRWKRPLLRMKKTAPPPPW